MPDELEAIETAAGSASKRGVDAAQLEGVASKLGTVRAQIKPQLRR